jgi:hypothetical protein
MSILHKTASWKSRAMTACGLGYAQGLEIEGLWKNVTCPQCLAFAPEPVLFKVQRDALLKAILAYIEWHGGCHEADCPQDDTCCCAGKPTNDLVNAAIKLAQENL